LTTQLSTDILAAAGRLLQPSDASGTLTGLQDQWASRAMMTGGTLIGLTEHDKNPGVALVPLYYYMHCTDTQQ